MQIHNPTYCCSQMATWIANNVIAVNYVNGTAHMNVLYTPTPGDEYDPEPTIERIELVHCPNCGDSITVYSQPVPAPEYTRATVTGGVCNDVACRFHEIGNTCAFALRDNLGCYSIDAAVRVAYGNLRTNINNGWTDLVTE